MQYFCINCHNTTKVYALDAYTGQWEIDMAWIWYVSLVRLKAFIHVVNA